MYITAKKKKIENLKDKSDLRLRVFQCGTELVEK